MGGPTASQERRGFTLIELVGVLVILSALSIAVVPTLERIERSRRTALAVEVERRLTLARASAMATGDPHGVRFDLEGQSIATVRIEASGAEPSLARAATGGEVEATRLASEFPGASIESLVNGDGTDAHDTVWFAYDGSPHLRESDGTLVGPFTEDATIRILDGRAILVRFLTGLVEQGP